MQPLFNEKGHVFPSVRHQSAVRFGVRHRIDQPKKMLPGLIIGTLDHLFPKEVTFPSVGEFTDRIEAIVKDLRQNEETANILNGAHLPICLPKLDVKDYGHVFESLFLKVLARAYGNAFPGRTFLNHLRGRLNRQLKVLPESRHQRLVAKMADRPVVGVYFPTAFHGYSAQSSRGLVQTLPSTMLLAGGLDTATALIVHRGVLAGGGPAPDLSLVALSWQAAPDHLLSFKAWPNALTLNGEARADHPVPEFSGGLLVVERDL